jgi:hypothetical protein
VADFVVELGAVVVVVTAVVGVETAPEVEPDVVPLEESLDEDDVEPAPDALEPAGALADAVVPGISLETTSPRTAVAPVARIATARDVARTLVPARSRRSALRRTTGSVRGEALMPGMSPCQPRIPPRVG